MKHLHDFTGETETRGDRFVDIGVAVLVVVFLSAIGWAAGQLLF